MSPFTSSATLPSFSTSQLDGPGRPVETFHKAEVLSGPTIEMEATDLAKVLRNPVARIIEFETPAVILCASKAETIPETYRTGYLDLFSHRPETRGADWQVRLLLRFNTPQPLADQGHCLKLTAPAEGGDPAGKLDLAFTLAADLKPAKVRAVEMTLKPEPGQGQGASINARFLLEDGTSSIRSVALSVTRDVAAAIGLSVTLSLTGDPDVWADMSALWSWRGSKGGAFDFDWLFGPPGDPSANPEREVGPAALAALREAQARIISTSPPIPVNRTP